MARAGPAAKGSNRTFMELKLCNTTDEVAGFWSSNRTFMELKFGCYKGDITSVLF